MARGKIGGGAILGYTWRSGDTCYGVARDLTLGEMGGTGDRNGPTGWLAGIGYEHPLKEGWTLRGELQYMDVEDMVSCLGDPALSVGANRIGLIRLA